MSDIDKRVVQMVFDNEDFEKNIAKSQKSLESMDKTINKVAENTSAKNIGNVLESSVGKAVEGATLKVEALRSVINTVMSSITSSVMGSLNKVQAMINNLTFDQMNVGFGKYEEKLTSVQTIMNATGRSIEYVEEQLEKLNWFTDETSYNFSDMANNIGKFTAVGVELEQASSAMHRCSAVQQCPSCTVHRTVRSLWASSFCACLCPTCSSPETPSLRTPSADPIFPPAILPRWQSRSGISTPLTGTLLSIPATASPPACFTKRNTTGISGRGRQNVIDLS